MTTEVADISLSLQGQFGAKSLNNIVAQCEQSGIKKPLIVTDPVMVKIGVVQRVADLFSAAGLPSAVYDQCVENPVVPDITGGAEQFKSEKCDGIIGLGGGSPIDQAKVIRIVARYGGTALDYNALKGGMQKIKPDVIPMVAVPTTSGTGSEASEVSMITDPERKVKFPIKSPFIKPNRIILDPELAKTMPPLVTAATGFDALVHALESYVNLSADLFAYSLNRTVFELVGRSLKTAVENGEDPQARGDMAMAALMAGMTMAITGLGAVHSLAHPLSALAGIPHGTANSIMLPYVMEFNGEAAGHQYIEAVRLLGFQVSTMDEAIASVSGLAEEIGLPTTLSAAGVSEDLLEQLSIDAYNDPTHRRNPIPTTQEDLKKMYASAM
jgi:lactaldehyde reductase